MTTAEGGPSIITDGLVLHLDAANPKSYPGTGNAWSDLSGKGNNFTLVNGVNYDIDNNGILILDGVDEYTISTYGETTYPLNDNSVSMWIYPIGTDNEGVFSIGVNGYYNSYIWLILNSQLRFYGPSNNSTVFYEPNIQLNFNEWQNIVRTRDDNTGTEKTYLNGKLTHTQNNWRTNTTLETPGVVSLGIELDSSTGGGTNQSYQGKYSMCMVYDKELTPHEVLQNYNATKSRFNL